MYHQQYTRALDWPLRELTQTCYVIDKLVISITGAFQRTRALARGGFGLNLSGIERSSKQFYTFSYFHLTENVQLTVLRQESPAHE